MIWIGLAIVVVTFYLIYKNYEARLVLALSWLGDGVHRTSCCRHKRRSLCRCGCFR